MDGYSTTDIIAKIKKNELEGKKIDLNNKTIVVMYMLYFGDMVSITPFLEVLQPGSKKGRKLFLSLIPGFKESVQYNPNG